MEVVRMRPSRLLAPGCTVSGQWISVQLVWPAPSIRAGNVATPHWEGLRWVPASDKAGLSPCSNFSLSLAVNPANASNPKRQATRNRTCMDRWLTMQRDRGDTRAAAR